jgi:hypothetical protein
LKTWPAFFSATEAGIKPFEMRRDDRQFRVGDVLELCEFDPDGGAYTGRVVRRRVTYVMRGKPAFGLKAGYVVMGLKP